MSHKAKSNLGMPGDFGQSQTMFYTQGSKFALVVAAINGRRQERKKRFANPHTALDWCMAHQCAFVFLPLPAAERN